jgi:hypothetical protein
MSIIAAKRDNNLRTFWFVFENQLRFDSLNRASDKEFALANQ